MTSSRFTEIGEPVKVGAVFDKARIFPKWFFYKGSRYKLEKVNYEWVDFRGSSRILCYAVSDGNNLYELSLNMKMLSWRLEKIYLE
ncbi:MAG: hypothetical protein GX817_06530 [Elusimicrobia bacterium]|nr:hypothetical protein [Elusimicrobiota bacterium]